MGVVFSFFDPRKVLFSPVADGTTDGHGESIYGVNLVCDANLRATGLWYSCIAIVSAMCFILSLKGLSEVKSAKWGCIFGSLGMLLAIVGTWLSASVCDHGSWSTVVSIIPGAILGTFLALKVTMIQMPQLVGGLNALGGLASAIEAIGLFLDSNMRFGPNGAYVPDGATDEESKFQQLLQQKSAAIQSVALHTAIVVGSITFFGSIMAALKLNGIVASKARVVPMRGFFNFIMLVIIISLCVVAELNSFSKPDAIPYPNLGYGTVGGVACVLTVFVLSGIWGVQFVAAIGGADMPVVICVLNTGSGIAGVFAGFMLANKLLVITGTFVASSGIILSVIMCVAMNRSIMGVLLGGFGESSSSKGPAKEIVGEIKEISLDELAENFNTAQEIVIVPGYGMAAGCAQHAVAAVTKTLRERGIIVRFAIHPVAGRLPGHMNVLLAEAQVPYQIVKEMDDVNQDFPKTDIVLVLGANDIVNPDAQDDPNCPIAGMPVLEVWKAKRTIVNKRGKGTGYSGVENPLFYKENNFMFYGNAQKKMEELAAKLSTMKPVGGASSTKAASIEEVTIKVKEVLQPCDDPKFTIGVLAEDCEEWEKRVALVPSICAKLTKLNYQVYLERGAGVRSNFLDEEYLESGVIIKNSREEVIASSQCINTVMPTKELLSCSPSLKDKFVVCWVGKLTPDGKDLVQKCAEAGINLIDVTSVPRITIAQKLDVLSSQAKIAGVRGTIEGACLYQRFFPQEMTAAGKYPPAQVMVLGAGVAGLAAIGQARALGAEVRAWDVRDVSDQVQSMGGKWITVDFTEEGAGSGGYAKESSTAFQEAQKATFHRQCKECDIIITTAAIPGRKSPLLIEDYMVNDMKPGSVVVDLAAMGGGNCSLTKKGETIVTANKVTICGRLDLPSTMAMQASDMFAANMFNMYQHIACAKDKQGDAANVLPMIESVMAKEFDEVVTSQIMCTYNGVVLNPGPPPMPSAPQPKKDTEVVEKVEIKKVSVGGDSIFMTTQFLVALLFIICMLLAILNHETLVDLVLVFMLSAWIGYMLVKGVQPALHTPLMSVSNAISGQVILGGILMISAGAGDDPSKGQIGMAVMGALATFVASVNVFGGFVITLQMLKMFK